MEPESGKKYPEPPLGRFRNPGRKNIDITEPDHQWRQVTPLEGAKSLGQGRLAGGRQPHLEPGHGLDQGVAALPAHLGQDVRRGPEQHQQARHIADFRQFTLQLWVGSHKKNNMTHLKYTRPGANIVSRLTVYSNEGPTVLNI